MSARLTDAGFKWIPPDNDSAAFRQRQRARMKQAEEMRKAAAEQAAREAATTNVQPINKRKARA